MFHLQSHDARLMKWQGRLSRVPRWAWIAFFVVVLVPVVVLAVFSALTIIVVGATVLAAVLVVGGILGVMWKFLHRRPNLGRGDGRKNVQIVVRSSRVIDP